MTSRNVATRMTTAPRKTAGLYYVDVSFTGRANESVLNIAFCGRLDNLAERNGGVPSSNSTTCDSPGIATLKCSYLFQNRAQALFFSQISGVPHDTKSIVFVPDVVAIAALP